jgi:hypothetical protein
LTTQGGQYFYYVNIVLLAERGDRGRFRTETPFNEVLNHRVAVPGLKIAALFGACPRYGVRTCRWFSKLSIVMHNCHSKKNLRCDGTTSSRTS